MGYKDGLVVIDDKYTVEDILGKNTLTNYALAKFDGFIDNAALRGNTYYASPNGSADANSYITLEQAAAIAEPGDTIILKGGTYRTTLTPANSGSANSPITYKAAKGEKVIISALCDLGAPTEVTNHTFNTSKAVYSADAAGIDLGLGRNQIFVTYNGETEVQTEARYPNGPEYLKDGRLSNLWGVEGNIYKSAGTKYTATTTEKEDGTTATTYSYADDVYNLIESDSLLNQEDDYWKGGIWVGQFGNAYALNSGKIEGSSNGKLVIDDTERTGRWWWNTWAEGYNQSYHSYVESTTKQNVPSNHFNYGYITGHRNALDIEGEWIMENDKVYIVLPSGVSANDAKIEAKARPLVIDLSGKEYINIEGIETIGGSVNMNGSKMCMLNDMDMKNITHFTLSADQKNGFIDAFPYDQAAYNNQNGAPLRGEVGIFVSGSDNAIVNSTIDHSAGAGVYLNGTYTYLDNNVINDCGYGGAYYAGIHTDVFTWENVAAARGGHGIYNNTVFNTGRACLDFNVSENSPSRAGSVFLPCEIAYNDFHDANITATDTGITYANGMNLGLDEKMSTMHHNYVYSTFGAEDKHPYMHGIYWDGNAHGCDTYNNVIFTTDDEAVFSAGHIVQQSADGSEAAMRIWDNQSLGYVEGGAAALDAHYFSEERPFFAGSTIGKTPYTKNLAKFRDGDYGISYKASVAEKSAGVTIESDGYAKFTASGDYLVFKNVDFGTGADELS
ncbi:MAG: hypothetical protein IJA16_00300, partial [Clostridia bacterium]|nr:hypothetical protein [Clostridia bacterium]